MTPEPVEVTVRFVSIMQRYSGKGNREVQLDLPPDPAQAVDSIIERYQMPWVDDLERQVRIFIGGLTYDAFIASGQRLKGGEVIAFIPISGGG